MDQATQQSDNMLSVTTDRNRKTIADYLGDMISLESHIEEALDRQLKEVKDSPKALAAVQRFHDMVKANRDALKAHQEKVGNVAGNPVKEAGSALLGKAAGIIDMVRTEGISKALRDDYTAFNHAAIGYTMLHTTAMALGDRETTDLAARGLRDHARAVQEINHLLPEIVVEELKKDSHRIENSGVVEQCRADIDRIWRESSTGASAV